MLRVGESERKMVRFMKVLVTGANGYLGQGVVDALLRRDIEVIATGRKTDKVNEKAIRVDCDLFEISDPFAFFGQPDILLHMAWRDGFVHYADSHVADLPRHYSFLKKFAESNVRRIVGVGSMHEIGFFEGCISESTPCNPITPYGISKNALRQLTEILCQRNDKQFQWLRGYYIVGNAKSGSSIFSKIALAEADNKTDFPFTMGQNQFDFVDYQVFCDQVADAVIQDTVLGIINICSGRPEKLADRVERFIQENNYKIKLKYGAFPDRPYDSKAVWGDDRKIRTILSLKSE